MAGYKAGSVNNAVRREITTSEHLTPVLKKNPNINHISPQNNSTTSEAVLIEKTTPRPDSSKRRIQAEMEDLEEI